MSHPIYRVISFEVEAPYTLRVRFDDKTEPVIDFQAVLEGELLGPFVIRPFSTRSESTRKSIP